MLGRRQLLVGAVRGILLAFFAGLPFALGRFFAPQNSSLPSKRKIPVQHDRLRPPGAMLDDEAFRRACINCNLCGEVCPPKCITFDKAGGLDHNTPFIEPATRGCTLCGKCMEVCPTEALSVTAAREVDMGEAVIDRLTCYPWANTGVCGACVSICPLGERAMGFEFANMYRPVVQPGCVGCGLCVESCPHPSLPIRIVSHQHSVVDAA